MIKLIWNTHNQKIPSKTEEKKEDLVNYNWGIYHQRNSDKWIFHILKKVDYKLINSPEELESNDTLIIVDSSIEKKQEFYKKLKLICSKMFLIHLGDESGAYDLTSIYNNFNYVWRSFCLNKFFNNKKVKCLPIGYKSGVFLKKNATDDCFTEKLDIFVKLLKKVILIMFFIPYIVIPPN